MTDILKKFKSIFEGLDIARGETRKTGEVSAKGKSITRSKTITEPPTDKLWEDHLKGTEPALGIIPIRRDNTCIWGCIDWDVYPLDHKEIVNDLNYVYFLIILLFRDFETIADEFLSPNLASIYLILLLYIFATSIIENDSL